MLTIDIKINGRTIAHASAANLSKLAPISSYGVTAREDGSEETGLGPFHDEFVIRDHMREQSVWRLVEKIAKRCAATQRNEAHLRRPPR